MPILIIHGDGDRRVPHAVGLELFEAAHEVHKVLERQIGMQTADDLELGNGFGEAFSRRLPRLFKRHRVGVGRALLAAEGA